MSFKPEKDSVLIIIHYLLNCSMVNINRSHLFAALLFLLFSVLFINKSVAQFPSTTIPKIIFHDSDAAVHISRYYIQTTDSVHAIDLALSVHSKIPYRRIDSVWFILRGAENLRMTRSDVRTNDRTYFYLKYVFKKTSEPFPLLTLEINSGREILGKINFQAEQNILRLALADKSDTLTTYTYSNYGCIYVSSVKHLVTPTLPENNLKTYKFKHQVKSSDEFKPQAR